ncbi:Phospholipase D1 [Leucoagaricus sp. SymC.cos]|nr:Phospholipase D1 [Leucoagaricus sp. SymC.cos]
MSVFKEFAKLTQKGAKHARDEVIGRWNPNRRHDEPEEQEQDRILAEIRASHRFDSFAGRRSENTVKWHIDGHDYMWALSEMLESAKEVIFILDWWLTPELYLRRPPAKYPEYRLDRILKRKAEQGVMIHVIVYKEVTQTMSMSSKHTKSTLERLHPKISCMRHPDHIGAKDSVQFWSHHEKVVVVDNHYAAIGGLDLCFGRWDTHTHPLADVHPTDFSQTLFPGQDYNNARIMDFHDVFNYASNQLSILESPRMPWHDVHMTFTGPVVLDVCQHFVERWNEIKKRKVCLVAQYLITFYANYRNEERWPWLALPEEVPEEAVSRHPHLQKWRDIGHKYKQRWHGYDEPDPDYPATRNGTCNVQVVRSVSDWSHGVLTEHSIQNAYIKLIEDAEHFIYIENQFFISSTKEGEVVVNMIGKALVDRIIRAATEGKKFQVIVLIPEVPGFAGDVKNEGSLKTIMAAQYRTINRGGHSIYEKIREAGYEPLDYIRFYHLRSYDRINAPLKSYISRIEEASGVKFAEAQIALSRKWIDGDMLTSQTTVKITIPQETTEGLVHSDKTHEEVLEFPIPESDEQAEESIKRFEDGAKGIRGDEDVSDNVCQHMLDDRSGLLDEQWLGTEEEELNSYVTELLYIHSKVMIVDDRRVIMGSANINDRSQKGDGDSEICLVVEDTEMINSTMNGQSYQVSRFAASLRRKLYREHLGLIKPQIAGRREAVTEFMRPVPHSNPDETFEPEDQLVADPLSEETNRLWKETAHRNREIFSEIFKPVPSNIVRNWKSYDNYVPKNKTGHVAPGVTLERVKDRLSQVKGALVEAPLDFLIEESDFVSGPEWKGLNPTLPIYI